MAKRVKHIIHNPRFSSVALLPLLVLAVVLGVYINFFSSAAPTPAANLWLDTSGGTCIRQSTQAAYVDAQACGSFDAAWDAANSGDTIRVKAGTYGLQKTDGDKTSETKIIGESKSSVILRGHADCKPVYGSDSVFCADAANLTLENVTLDSTTHHNAAASARIWPNAHHVTFRNVDLWGDGPALYIEGPNFTWQGGSHGKDGYLPPPIVCGNGDGEPVWVTPEADRTTLDGIRFNVKKISVANGCTPHVENIRLQDDTDDFTLKNSWFLAGSDAGSGHIFTGGSGPRGHRVKIINNIFEPVDGSYTIQASNQCDWYFAYNTFMQPPGLGCTSLTWVGNLGVNGTYPGCSGTHIRNLWQTTGSCGSDTFIGSASIGIGSGGRLTSSSPAINAGETNSGSDVCTGAPPDGLGSIDFEGDTRPVGAACDAGADEYGGVTAPPDTTTPTTSLTAPTGGTISGTVNLTASASDNIGVTKVEFYVSGTKIGEDTTAPYSFSWNTTTTANGSKTLSSKAYDAAGNIGTSASVSVTVNNPATCTKQGDLNCDNAVNIFDLSILLSKYNTSDQAADLNRDGNVNIFDLSILLSKFGT